MSYKIETRCMHLDEDIVPCEKTGSISFPIYQTATFCHEGVGKSTGYDYTRLQNPTRERLEKIVAKLEGGIDALAFSSGMAAITTLMELFKPGDHLIVENDLYGGSVRLFDHVNKKNGIEFTGLDLWKDNVEDYIKENTKAVFVETPTNPMMNVTDIQALADKLKDKGILLIVDNTFLSPYLQNPLKLGADIVVHSGTKYLGGHNDTLAGFIIVDDDEVSDKLRFLIKTTGAGLSPFDSWLIMRGIQTLSVRMERAQSNAGLLAEWLSKQPGIKRVIYPGLSIHPGHEIMKKQARGFGAMLTFECESKELALKLLEDTKLIQYAESLGGTETLITYPLTQTHADVPEEKRLKNGITDKVLRLSVGLEAIEDLIADFEQALQ
ncbi:MAG: PLP-dependent aspartate aminotransferase family protein [Lachnospiraceae bacterium]|nr:PLP-dependent aspartate aminotransferase family protein [Lachnospiraceae bacterium]